MFLLDVLAISFVGRAEDSQGWVQCAEGAREGEEATKWVQGWVQSGTAGKVQRYGRQPLAPMGPWILSWLASERGREGGGGGGGAACGPSDAHTVS